MAENTLGGHLATREATSGVPAHIPKLAVSVPHQSPAVRFRELAALLLLVVLSDLTLYRGAGYAGLAVFSFAGPLILLLGSPQPKLRASFWLLGGLILLMS